MLLLVLLAILIHGYHYGIEDQAIYLPAIKQDLNPALYPLDSQFFRPQNRPTILHLVVAESVRLTRVPVEWAVFGWQLVSLYLFLLGCLGMAKRLFSSTQAQWAGVLLVTVLLTLSVAGTALYLADQYLHPRTIATALLLFAIAAFLDRRWLTAALWVAVAAAFHIQMAFFGVVLIAFLAWKPSTLPLTAAALPFGNLFEPPNPGWREAARTRSGHYLLRWQWYEWVGVFAPWVLLYWFSRIKTREAQRLLDLPGEAASAEVQGAAVRALKCAWFCRQMLYFGAFIFCTAAVTTIPPQLERLTPYQPLRGYHLLYVFLFLIMGGMIGERVVKSSVWRWLALYVPLALVMFYAQRQLFPGSRHIEGPGLEPRNQWVQAFEWVKANTPGDAYFVLDPRYMDASGEDQHGFRGLAERSQMADWVKDPGPVTLFPAIGPEWQREVHALDGFGRFEASDFRRLHHQFGVNWVLLQRPPEQMTCPYHNGTVWVCRIE